MIIVNLLFGIILDSFAELREKASFTKEDIKNKCFICNIDSFTVS
jgi:hypothetical protein